MREGSVWEGIQTLHGIHLVFAGDTMYFDSRLIAGIRYSKEQLVPCSIDIIHVPRVVPVFFGVQ